MIPMFPFSINNTLKLFTNNNMDSIDEEAIKERISKAVMQSIPNKRNVRMNAIVVLEYDNDQRRTIVINETMNANVNNNNSNCQNVPVSATFQGNSFTPISSNDHTNSTNVLLSQQPIFPATMEGLQAILNLTSSVMNRTNMSDNVVHNGFSFIPMQQRENIETHVKVEKQGDNHESGLSSRKRKSEKPCRIPQDAVNDANGLDLTLGGRYEGDVKVEKYYPQNNNVAIWPCPVSTESRALSIIQPMVLSRVKKASQLPGHKKSSKVFNCNQCKLQFNSLNALCKHTFSDHRAFRCTFCSANFTQRSNLQRHSLKHVGFKPFICNVCNKAYYRKDHLVRHIEVSHPGSDPKSNITVKLSSSECLEYLEKMQINKINEMEQNNFLLATERNSSFLETHSVPTESSQIQNLTITELSSVMEIEPNNFLSAEDRTSMSSETGNGPIDTSPMTMPQYDETRDPSLTNDGSESPEKLQISFDETVVKLESRCEDIQDYQCVTADGPLPE